MARMTGIVPTQHRAKWVRNRKLLNCSIGTDTQGASQFNALVN